MVNIKTVARSTILALLITCGVVLSPALAHIQTAISMEPTNTMSHPRLWIVTGGQTGVDRAALDTALSLFLPVRGWCPKGRLAEDGTIAPIYPLQETNSTDYAVRTEWNVRDSDGTMILAYGTLSGGTKLTAELARKYHRPVLVIDALSFSKDDVTRFQKWIQENHVRILNVAGPRESSQPGVIYKRAQVVLSKLLSSD